MQRRTFLTSALALAALSRTIGGKAATKAARIGWLTAQRAPSLAPYVEAFRAGLADLGHIDGRNLAIEFRYGDDSIERVPELASELVRLPVDLIVVQGAAVPVLASLGLPVPIVFVFSGDPISAGLADTLAHPRDTMTGLTFMAAELNAKRLELLREIMPELSRVTIIANPEHPGEHIERADGETAARRLGLATDYFPTRSKDELAQAFATMAARPPQAILLFADGFAVQNRQSIIDFGIRHRAPVISGWPIFAQSGAICSYGPHLIECYRRLAHYVDRVLDGTPPGDLPIERPTRFELAINLRTATALDLTVPPSLLVRADDVIE